MALSYNVLTLSKGRDSVESTKSSKQLSPGIGAFHGAASLCVWGVALVEREKRENPGSAVCSAARYHTHRSAEAVRTNQGKARAARLFT